MKGLFSERFTSIFKGKKGTVILACPYISFLKKKKKNCTYSPNKFFSLKKKILNFISISFANALRFYKELEG